jgi:hypothetical protein
MRLSTSLLGLLLLNCGGSDIPIGANDSGAQDSGATCDPTAAFGTPAAVVGPTGSAGYLRLSSDYLTAYYASAAIGLPGNMFVATRGSSADAAFGTGSALATGYGQAPTVTGDALTLYFARNNGNPLEVFATTRASATDAFSTTASLLGPPVDDPPTAYDGNYDPFIREDGQVLYFVHNLVGGGSSNPEIYRATFSSGTFTSATAVAELDTSLTERSPTVTPDDLVIYFARGGPTAGLDIYVATRSSKSDPFGAPKLVSELATGGDERPDFITRDRCTLYFDRITRDDAGLPLSTIYLATKAPK